eukprot:TRINITY_DN15888_c0_g1::TRINITY_DN15888_c0_g1_i1::g.22477::m.22477 TRINITY_DN15888_c0_g1::TRINITY_DN15888_c0_g1_i1::g.22477  ORF type:complete len:238 (-),score=9.61,OsmC/PF02566.14/2e-06 TRINITY_DN15888_c0_g1_i1:575-1222(-)
MSILSQFLRAPRTVIGSCSHTVDRALLTRGLKTVEHKDTFGIVVGEEIDPTNHERLYNHQIYDGTVHKFETDLPLHHGGRDVASSPKSLLLAALASDTLHAVRKFANSKHWHLDRAFVACRYADTAGKDVHSPIHVHFHFDGQLTHQQRLELTEVANQSEVMKYLRFPVTVKAEFEEKELSGRHKVHDFRDHILHRYTRGAHYHESHPLKHHSHK